MGKNLSLLTKLMSMILGLFGGTWMIVTNTLDVTKALALCLICLIVANVCVAVDISKILINVIKAKK